MFLSPPHLLLSNTDVLLMYSGATCPFAESAPPRQHFNLTLIDHYCLFVKASTNLASLAWMPKLRIRYDQYIIYGKEIRKLFAVIKKYSTMIQFWIIKFQLYLVKFVVYFFNFLILIDYIAKKTVFFFPLDKEVFHILSQKFSTFIFFICLFIYYIGGKLSLN